MVANACGLGKGRNVENSHMIPLPEDLEPTKLYWKVLSEPKIETDQCFLGLLGIPFIAINFAAVQDSARIQKAIPRIFKVQLTSSLISEAQTVQS